MEQNLRTLKIKTGSCNRLFKDLEAYKREETEQRQVIQNLRESGASPSDIKRQEQVLGETLQMLPDTRGRLEDAFLDLQALMEELSADANVTTSPEWTAAQQIIQTLTPLFG